MPDFETCGKPSPDDADWKCCFPPHEDELHSWADPRQTLGKELHKTSRPMTLTEAVEAFKAKRAKQAADVEEKP